jgi:hypothetical protein
LAVNPKTKNSVTDDCLPGLNDFNRYLLSIPEENFKQLDQDEIIEILDQAKAPECHEAMVNENIAFLRCLMKNLYLISSV